MDIKHHGTDFASSDASTSLDSLWGPAPSTNVTLGLDSALSDSGDSMIKPVTIPNHAASATTSATIAPSSDTSPTAAQEVQFINGLNPNGTVATSNDFWIDEDGGDYTFKNGTPTAGTGATVTFAFDPSSNFTAQEKNTVLTAMANWEAVANVTFVEDDNAADVSTTTLLIHRGSDGGAYTTNNQTAGSGATLGQPTGQVAISIDTSVPGFDLSGSFDTIGGYGLSTIIHELGHFLGLGHGGAYNGNVDETTQQFSAFDDRQYSIMSYIFYADTDAKYFSQNPNPGTDWGVTNDGYLRQAPHTIQMLDIQAIQQLYGAAAKTATPFSGGQTYGFNSNITGLLHNTYDFTVNTQPVVTLFNEGTGNTLDVSGYSAAERIDLHGGSFSDVGGLKNNLAIAVGTKIDTAIGGTGADTLTANNDGDVLNGGAGADTMVGGTGNDTFYVDNTGDHVVEGVNGGNDMVYSSVSYGLAGQFIETLTLTGTANINATGNGQNNTLNGNSGNNVLDGGAGADTMAGGAGDDTYYVDNVGDHVIEGATGGNDTVYSSVSFSLSGQFIETLNLIGSGNINATGNNQNNTLNGNAGNNVLDGGGGADTMAGGAGNDTYYVDNVGDHVIEANNGGNDTVYSSVSFSLSGQFIETLVLTGTANINATGNNQANTLIGNTGNNVITTGAGADIVQYYNPVFGADTITDFTAGNAAGHDTLLFTSSVFSSYAAVTAHAAQVGSDVIITYDAHDTIDLQHVTLASLTANDFLFAP